MAKNYRVPEDPEYQYIKSDTSASGKKKNKINPPAFGSPLRSKQLMIHILPFTDIYKTSGNRVDLEYKLSTISRGQFYMQNQTGDFEGDYGFENRMYNFLKILKEGSLAERRAIIFSKNNSYSGYINFYEQSGKAVRLRLQVKRRNPELPKEIKNVKFVELKSLPKNYGEKLGLNVVKEQQSYDDLIKDSEKTLLGLSQTRKNKSTEDKSSLAQKKKLIIAIYDSVAINKKDFVENPLQISLLMKYAPTKFIKKSMVKKNIKKREIVDKNFLTDTLNQYSGKISLTKINSMLHLRLKTKPKKFDEAFVWVNNKSGEKFYTFLLKRVK